jgi:hypothetical protein
VNEIEVNALGPGQFGVQVREGDTRTSHRVTVPEGMVDDLHLGAVDPSQLVQASFAFLLEREPGTAILRQFSLSDISRYFPEYAEELQRRLGPRS